MNKSGRNSRLVILIPNPIPIIPCKKWPYLAPKFIKGKYKPASLSQTHLVRKIHTNKDAFKIKKKLYSQTKPANGVIFPGIIHTGIQNDLTHKKNSKFSVLGLIFRLFYPDNTIIKYLNKYIKILMHMKCHLMNLCPYPQFLCQKVCNNGGET